MRICPFGTTFAELIQTFGLGESTTDARNARISGGVHVHLMAHVAMLARGCCADLASYVRIGSGASRFTVAAAR